ncbi:MAG TPA: polysaccharide pyruvyl transferase family protein [Candidatus Polarisedimenticolia bacterium]|jgi:polysaccharide pyruvyl transferase WcaK-like protein|nr:polysaccharide pyruvyl transferase family protein [Candidatus Polarisedimenticolia bacterium]
MIDMDAAIEAWVSGLIELNKLEWMLGAGEAWKPGERLKLLLAGYNGTRNTGSDIRVEEILRQLRRILGCDNIALSVMTQNFDLTRGYFGDAKQVHLPDVFPPFLHAEVRKNHGVIACEGSMFKSKFASALTAMMIGALGIASAQNKLSVAYGGEAGAMDPLLQRMCRRFCRDSLVITRNVESQTLLGKLGIATELGTDTAWTFEPLGPDYGSKALRDAGWDGSSPILAVCPINPFWWPVKPSLAKWLAHSAFGAYKKSYYRTIYFHKSGRDVDAAYEKYLAAMASGVEQYRRTRGIFIVLIGMEMLDRDACERVAEKLGGAPVFSSERFNMYEIVSVLRSCDRLLSSRFHAIVTSMPAGVPSAGVTMDERIRNLMRQRGHEHLVMGVDDDDLADKIVAALRALDAEADEMPDAMGRTVAHNIQLMARMGVYLEERVARRYPDFPVRTGVLGWEEYLPPLSPTLRKLLETHSGAVAA